MIHQKHNGKPQWTNLVLLILWQNDLTCTELSTRCSAWGCACSPLGLNMLWFFSWVLSHESKDPASSWYCWYRSRRPERRVPSSEDCEEQEQKEQTRINNQSKQLSFHAASLDFWLYPPYCVMNCSAVWHPGAFRSLAAWCPPELDRYCRPSPETPGQSQELSGRRWSQSASLLCDRWHLLQAVKYILFNYNTNKAQ